jgi:hypothetical protein
VNGWIDSTLDYPTNMDPFAGDPGVYGIDGIRRKASTVIE